MKILVVGSGSREHALLWKLQQSAVVDKLYCWPGNAAYNDHFERLEADAQMGWEPLVDAIKYAKIDAVIVGPEQPLAGGLADTLWQHGIPTFGPKKAGARLESSKSFSKDVMKQAGIPTADFIVVTSRHECNIKATEMLQRSGGVVLKASGLAAGKGVFVCKSAKDVSEGLYRLYDTDMKDAATRVVIEEMLIGREVSFFCLLGQDCITPLGFAVDFKRLHDHDEGPNTGGMGCYTPVPWLPADAQQQVLTKVVDPLLRELATRQIEYTGFLYVGVMWTNEGPKVIEFNVRLGDPEAQVLAMCDRQDWGVMIARHLGMACPNVAAKPAAHSAGAAVAVVIASKGYPFSTATDTPEFLAKQIFDNCGEDQVCVFGAAVQPHDNGQIKTGKGRILTVAAYGESHKAAQQAAYQRIGVIAAGRQETLHYRTDIGARVIAEN